MKISLEWLNDYLEPDGDAEVVATTLTQAGFPVEDRAQVSCSDGGVGTMLDVEITSNRGDCLSHVGLAREMAAAAGWTLVLPQVQLPEEAPEVESLAKVENAEARLCPLYTARVIEGVKVAPSPDWLVRYLETVGLRSVNNVVDVTNFVLLEMGQPLHAFDLDKLAGKQIRVRRAKEGEAFDAIDGSSHKLGSEMLVIADEQAPVAVAGVMGGLDSEVGEGTKNVLLESAIFDPLSVRTTSRALKLASDSSYRFERGVDPNGVDRASRRAAQLIVQLAGGQVAEGVIRCGAGEQPLRTVTMRAGRCNALLGTDLSAAQQAGYLSRLGLTPRVEDQVIECQVPSHRLDLHREVDLIEEVARLYGLDEIGLNHKIHIVTRPPQVEVSAEQALRQVLVGHGYHETVTFTFVSPKLGEVFVPARHEAVVIEDERRKAEPMLRPSLLPSLLMTRKANQDRGNADVALFETAATWVKNQAGVIDERRRLGLIRDAADAQHALRAMRTVIEEAAEWLAGARPGQRMEVVALADAPWYDVGAAVTMGDVELGTFGLISGEVKSLFGLQTAVVAGEFDLPAMLGAYPPARVVEPLPRYPGIERDLSIIVGEDVSWQAIESAVRGAEPELLESLVFLTTYRGKPIVKGRKSVSLRMVFRDPAGTLRHEQVDRQVESVVTALEQQVGAELRK